MLYYVCIRKIIIPGHKNIVPGNVLWNVNALLFRFKCIYMYVKHYALYIKIIKFCMTPEMESLGEGKPHTPPTASRPFIVFDYV